MDDLHDQSLTQVREALALVEDKRDDISLTLMEQKQLELASVKLRDIERSITTIKEKQVVDTLRADSTALYDLSNEMRQSAKKLEKVAACIGKATQAVGLLLQGVNTGLSSGLI